MNMKRIVTLMLSLLMIICLSACNLRKLSEQSYLNRQLTDTGFSGVVLMTKNGQTICKATGGIENPISNEPITEKTLFCIGSVSKQFTAAAILLLQQEGELSIDNHLTQYFPNYTFGKDLTLRHLLEMRSGITEFYDVEYIDDAFTELPTGELRDVITNDKSIAENQETLENWLLEQPLQFEPNTEYEYSNSNYFLLARIVEIVSGENYCDYVHSHIFKPLGMSHSIFIDEVNLRSLPHLATPTVLPQTVDVGVTMGLGDIISTVRDIDCWLTSLRTNALLTPESITMMSTDYTNEDDEHYGFGVHLYGNALFHFGYITTYQAMTYTEPENGINVFIVTNDDPNPDVDISDIGWNLIDRFSFFNTTFLLKQR